MGGGKLISIDNSTIIYALVLHLKLAFINDINTIRILRSHSLSLSLCPPQTDYSLSINATELQLHLQQRLGQLSSILMPIFGLKFIENVHSIKYFKLKTKPFDLLSEQQIAMSSEWPILWG